MAHGVRVRVPATSANLGPGFDSLGLALAWYDEVDVRITPGGRSGSPVALTVEGCGADTLRDSASNLVVRTLVATLAALGAPPFGLAVHCRNTIPWGRGLGSSAAALVAAVAAAHALADGVDSVDPVVVLDGAAGLEGHPDNVAACVLGAFTIAWDDEARPSLDRPFAGGARWRGVRLEPAPALAPVVLVPTHEVPTSTARAALPSMVPHAEAASTAGRAALLVAALTQHVDLLHEATADWLHQPYRGVVLRETTALVSTLRLHGLPAVVSGAGPSVLVLHDPQRASADHAPPTWEVRPVVVDRIGVAIEPLDA